MNSYILAALISGLLFSCQQVDACANDIYLMAELVRCEAGNQCLEGKQAVAGVIINRVESDQFPDTVEEVIFQKGQFSCMTDGHYEKYRGQTDDTDLEAVLLELNKREHAEVLYFSTNETVNGDFLYKIGDHYFSK